MLPRSPVTATPCRSAAERYRAPGSAVGSADAAEWGSAALSMMADMGRE